MALVRLNRPKQLNALNGPVMDALCDALEALDRDDAIRVLVVTGTERAFAAGADIGEMADASPIDMLKTNRIAQWDRVRRIGKPVIAAVAGLVPGRRLRAGHGARPDRGRPRARSSVSPRSRSGSCPAPAGRSACRGRWARARRWR